MSGGLKAVWPLISAAPAMKVCGEDEAAVAGRTRRCCRAARWSGRRPASGRCAARTPCRRSRWRRRTSPSPMIGSHVHPLSRGRSPVALQDVLVDRDRTSARLTTPSVSISRQRSGTGDLVVRERLRAAARAARPDCPASTASGSVAAVSGRRRPSTGSLARRRRLRRGSSAGRRSVTGWPAKARPRRRRVLQRGEIGRQDAGRSAPAAMPARASAASSAAGAACPARLADASATEGRAAHRHFPWQTFCSCRVRGTGANGQLT